MTETAQDTLASDATAEPGQGPGPVAAATPPTVPVLPLLAGIFLVSASILHLEILQTRIFSVLLWHHVTYLVVTFTLLGFAASGTVLSLWPGLLQRHPARFLAVCSLLFALTTHVAFQVLGRMELDTFEILKHRGQYLTVFVYYVYLIVPFVFAGLTVVGSLKVAGRRTGMVYGFNLGGSALGCLLFAALITPLGGEGSIFAAAATAALAAAAFAQGASSPGTRKGLGLLSVAVAVGSAAMVPVAPDVLPVRAVKSKSMSYAMERARTAGKEPEIVATRWDPLCRVDVVDMGDADTHQYMVYQDASAPTTIFRADYQHDPYSIYSLSYRMIEPGADVLVIGVGGGQDLRQAMWNGAASVTGVEINRSTAALVKGEFAEYSGHVYTTPPVTVHETEGRSFVRRADEKYDLIQMTGTDTYAALSSGSYVLSESYLYTLEAYQDYLDHLEDDGIIAVLRWRFFPPRESLRLAAIAVEAMRSRGIEHPENHVIVVDMVQAVQDPMDPEKTVHVAYSLMLFGKSPFTPEEVASAQAFIDQNPVPGLHHIGYAPGLVPETPNAFHHYFGSVAAGTDDQFVADYPYQVAPVTDDAPFFFNFHRWSTVLGGAEKSDQAFFTAIGEDPIGLFLLLTALVESAALVLLFVVLPLVFSKRIRMPTERRGAVLLYFLGIGIGFLFLEIAFMQRLVLYLGHPTLSITVVLFAFLFFSGLGSLVAGRFDGRAVGRFGLIVIALLIGAYSLFLPRLLDATLALSTGQRIAIALAMCGLPAFFMGMPFPSAMARFRGATLPFLPWAFAINGGASVIASVAAIFVAMAAGFTAVFWLSLACYLLALFADRGLPEAT